MYVSLHTDYAFRALMFLTARQNELSTTEEISRAYGISKNHMVRVLETLARNGFLTVVHGRLGGVRLAMSPDQINLGDVFRASEPSLKLVECFEPSTNTCPIAPVCGAQSVIAEAGNAFVKVLDRYTIQDLMKCGASRYLELFKEHRNLGSPVRRTKPNAGGVMT